MQSFEDIRARAAARKGGDAALAALLPEDPAADAVAKLSDDRLLSEFSKRIFQALSLIHI